MNDNVTAQIWQFLSGNAKDIVIPVITLVGGFFLWSLREKGKKRDAKLRTHFEQVVRAVLQPMVSITANIGIMANDNTIIVRVKDTLATTGESYERHDPLAESFEFEDTDEFVAFKTHYAAIENEWQMLRSRSLKLHDNMEAFHNRLTEHFEKTLGLPVRDAKPNEEGLGSYLPYEVSQALVRGARGENPGYGLSLQTVSEGDFYILRTHTLTLAKTKNNKLIEKCGQVIDETLKSQTWKQEASSLVHTASAIGDDFDRLTKKLKRIESLGVMTKDPQYKFQPIRTCAICGGLFF